MARSIAEIQQEIFVEKEKHSGLSGLTGTSKTSVWRLWIYIVSVAIWMHEKIVEKNALLSRPHTLHWYREQALNFLMGHKLIWKDGYFLYSDELTESQIKEAKIIKHCAISERFFDEIQPKQEKGPEVGNSNITDLISEYYYNQVGILTLKVAKENGAGNKVHLTTEEKRVFGAYMNQIKDAGTQIRVISKKGNSIDIAIEVYVDPLVFYIGDNEDKDKQNFGKLLRNLSEEPVKDIILEYISSLEFNGAFVPTFLLDKIQQVPGVELPILREITVDKTEKVYNDSDGRKEYPFFVPSSGYFDVETSKITITYKPYNLQTDPNFNI